MDKEEQMQQLEGDDSQPQPQMPTRTKRALLIGSSYAGLPGTENDIKIMTRILKRYGFDPTRDVVTLCGDMATRDNILREWGRLASPSTLPGDTVVVYYSGHGGLAQPPKRGAGRDGGTPSSHDDTSPATSMTSGPSRIQFLVPSDFDPDLKHWRGIFDAEISLLLRKTTARTRNVTYILDCCHAARLGRGPVGGHPTPKSLHFDYGLVLEHMGRLRESKKLLEREFWDNPDVVRIAAAADLETAWQYKNPMGEDVGVMTEQLDRILTGSQSRLSWRSILLGVKQLVKLHFPADTNPQQPESGGADVREPFSLRPSMSRALIAVVGDEYTRIEGGRVHGVRQDDVYMLIPFGSHELDVAAPVTYATIHTLRGLSAVSYDVTADSFGAELALALPYERHRPWPASCPAEKSEVLARLASSGPFRPCRENEMPVVEFRPQGGEMCLYGRGTPLASGRPDSPDDMERLFAAAHVFAQSWDLVSTEPGIDDEEFMPDMEIEVGLTRPRAVGKSHRFEEEKLLVRKLGSTSPNEPLHFTEGDRYYIRMRIKGLADNERVYVNILHVDAAGKTNRLTVSHAFGQDLSNAVKRAALFLNPDTSKGIPIFWPGDVPSGDEVSGAFVFLITPEPADVRSLEVLSLRPYMVPRGGPGDDVVAVPAPPRRAIVPYSVMHVHYRLHRLRGAEGSNPVEDELDKEAIESLGIKRNLFDGARVDELESSLRNVPLDVAAQPKSLGQVFRYLRGIQPVVYIVNVYSDDIWVVVKKFRPMRQLASVGANASPAGGGLDLSHEYWRTDDNEKLLAPMARDPNRCIGEFDLWTRHDGFGVVSIYTGPDKTTPHLLNSRIPMGATAYFDGGPNLRYLIYDKPTKMETGPLIDSLMVVSRL